jgi:hypothetical protein
MPVFQCINGLTDRGMRGINNPGGTAFNRHLLPKQATNGIIARLNGIVSAGQMTVAGGANRVFGGRQPMLTNHTGTWFDNLFHMP